MSEVQQTEVKAEYIDERPPPSTPPNIKQSDLQSEAQVKKEAEADKPIDETNATEPSPDTKLETISTLTLSSETPRQSRVEDLISTTATSTMADGKNEARALRVLEIMNDFRTLQLNITSLVTRAEAAPPDQSSYNLPGYAVLRQCNAHAQAILSTQYNPGNMGIEPGHIPDTEKQKATLQKIILDAASRRFQAHKIYLRAAAGMRWVMLRKQVMSQNVPMEKKRQALSQIDGRLSNEINALTDESVIEDLRNADGRKNYWLDEDPSLERMLAWIRRQS